jgi:5'-3' exonuclease
MTTRLHVVDGTFELFRAHFSQRPGHVRPDGKEAKATVGLIANLISLLADRDEKVTHIAIAFDNPIRSFRNDIFPGYKSDEGMLPELRAQFDDVEVAARALGVTVWSMDRWEADDALATAAVKFSSQVDQVRILTPDKDLGQMLSGDHIVQVDRIRNKVINESVMREARGVPPASIPDLLALVGDDADGLPGVPGFGAKGAATLLAEYQHIENIPRDPNAWRVSVRGAPKLSAALEAMREEVMMYKLLATLVRDVPLQESLEDLRWKGAPRAEFEAWCDAVGTTSLRDRAFALSR